MSLVEFQAADHLVGHTVTQAGLLQRTRLGVDPVHHGYVPQLVSLPSAQPLNLLDDKLRFFLLVVALAHDDWHAPAVARPQGLLDALRVSGYQVAGRVEDRLRGAVVLLQGDYLGLRIIVLKAQDVSDVRVTPGVYGLVRVAHGADVEVVAGELLRDGILGNVRILKLVYHQVYVAFLVFLRDLRHLIQQEIGLQQQVVEVEGIALVQQRVVVLIRPYHDLVEVAGRLHGQPFGGKKLAFCARNSGEDGTRGNLFGIEVQLAHRALHEGHLV